MSDPNVHVYICVYLDPTRIRSKCIYICDSDVCAFEYMHLDRIQMCIYIYTYPNVYMYTYIHITKCTHPPERESAIPLRTHSVDLGVFICVCMCV